MPILSNLRSFRLQSIIRRYRLDLFKLIGIVFKQGIWLSNVSRIGSSIVMDDAEYGLL